MAKVKLKPGLKVKVRKVGIKKIVFCVFRAIVSKDTLANTRQPLRINHSSSKSTTTATKKSD